MELKQSTASQEILLGPFLDDDDGVTQKTGLTIANTDIKLFKTGATTLANKNSGGATEIATGFYYATLDATDTDTLGPLVIVVQMTDCLCVRHQFDVVSAAYYDWKHGSTKPDVNTYSITNNAITALSINDGAITNAKVADDVDVNTKTITAGAITSTAIADGAIDAATFAANALDQVWSTAARTLTAIDEDNTTLDLDSTIETILAASATIAALPTAAENADAVWDEVVTTGAHDTATYAGAGLLAASSDGLVSIQDDVDAILADTNELQSDDYPASIAAIKTVVDLIEDIVRNQLEITDADGTVVLRADNSTDALYTVSACVTDNSTTTIRKRLA